MQGKINCVCNVLKLKWLFYISLWRSKFRRCLDVCNVDNKKRKVFSYHGLEVAARGEIISQESTFPVVTISAQDIAPITGNEVLDAANKGRHNKAPCIDQISNAAEIGNENSTKRVCLKEEYFLVG